MTASIIIPNHNEWQTTWNCIRGIRAHTPESHEVILVDNGSDRIPEWGRQDRELTLIRNRYNRGFAAAVNQGLRAATGEYLVLLNNDTLPSHRWLTQLLRVFSHLPSVGLVGPVSNRVIPEQKIPVTLRSVEKIHRFCKRFNRPRPEEWREVRRLSGFCLVMPRAVMEKVGMLDERFGLGTCEDDDYSLRVRRAGYRLIVAGDTYVHHFGSTSFRKHGYREFRKLLNQNRLYFLHKWGILPETAASSGGPESVPTAPPPKSDSTERAGP
ncbi:glycosyltransferase family 2 protein [Staphylospora marina]|uniref:glycosyltransferase family 2 protein n=1 Tax=Staphylospora marina TaxID=2490858 RepID=UPI000F5BEF77|nr:glycosyltransferase family 2 protein [Staphylospora marina]